MKIHKGLFILFSLVLAGCSNTLTNEDWKILDENMSLQTVEEELGKPKKILIEEREMLDEINRKINDGAITELPAISYINLETLHKHISEGDDIKIYQYEIESEERDNIISNVYFFRDTVVFYDGMYSKR